jgi:hypothetical protein
VRLRRDFDDGTWRSSNSALQELQHLDVGYRLVVGALVNCLAAAIVMLPERSALATKPMRFTHE